MKTLVALLCTISALAGSVFSYKCISCMCRNSTTCLESETECLGDRCMAASQYYHLNRKELKSFYKGCANETLCEKKGSVIVKDGEFVFGTHCCTGELCNNQVYEIPKEDPTPNGVKCPVSMCLDTLEECKTDKKINCTGSMDRCIDYRATLRIFYGKDTKYSGKGCANSDLCRYNTDSNIGIDEMHRGYLKCY
ncbi:phospholipase A2 inhibitor and Ly6/PLAUR domain-containing protein-like [Anomaloglossus baeobatrachus]|uniref:phospholipase A2 inhibitor and Ly6/PLAUR domain-containing protein-like n=1 Tax=Anomaloglossus baeobatrachus TaxID=238106 RepID=UPI003F4FCB33